MANGYNSQGHKIWMTREQYEKEFGKTTDFQTKTDSVSQHDGQTLMTYDANGLNSKTYPISKIVYGNDGKAYPVSAPSNGEFNNDEYGNPVTGEQTKFVSSTGKNLIENTNGEQAESVQKIKEAWDKGTGYLKNNTNQIITGVANYLLTGNPFAFSSQQSMETAKDKPEPQLISTETTETKESALAELERDVELTRAFLKNQEEILKDVDTSTINYSQRVSLNVAPINKKENVSNNMSLSEWESRLGYVLGSAADVGINDLGSGFLYELFGPTKGIVFQYTPDISFDHNINYEETDIIHSNLSVQHYKNTPPPAIQLTADFTADNEENGIYMFGIIHFLRSISKCEFGKKVYEERENQAGVPPPILYLNGWGNLINNIPVVVTHFDVKLPKDKHYVYLSDYDIWLPTEMTFSIQLRIQFNLDKYKDQFDLNEYKQYILKGNTNYKDNVSIASTVGVTNGEYLVSKTYDYGDHTDIVSDTKVIMPKLVKDPIMKRYNGAGWTW